MSSSASVSSALRAWVDEAHARWPRIALDEGAFARHLDGLGRTTPAFPIDAYLAAACAASDPAAVRAFEDEHVARVPDAIRRVDGSAAFVGEIVQQLRIRLLVKDGDQTARIARYTGEVPLAAWIRVIALRLAFNAKRGAKSLSAGQEEGERDAGEMALEDPELDYLRGQYREPFVRALNASILDLTKDDRTILRLHYVDGLNIDGIGKIFQVHRATVARWLGRIRGEVLARAKDRLADEVGAKPDEASSVIGALAGEVDWTLSRVLKTSSKRPSST